MKFTLSLALMLTCIFLPSETVVFSVVTGSSGQDLAFCVEQTPDGGYVVAAQSDTLVGTGTRSKNARILRFDSLGRCVWNRCYGQDSVDDAAFCIQYTRSGEYVVAGTTASFGARYPSTWIMKLDTRGDTLWSRVYTGPIVSSARSVRQTPDGGYIIAGKGAENILKLDSLGRREWGTRIGWQFSSIEPTRDGGYILTGDSVYRPLDWGYIPALVIVKIDARGSLEWTAPGRVTYPGRGCSIQQTVDGGYIATGDSISFTATPDGVTHLQAWKLDSNGAVSWSHNGEPYSSGQSIRQTSDGGFILTGAVTDAASGVDVPVVKLDRHGTLLWRKEHGVRGGWEYAASIRQTRDGGYIVAGQTDSYGACAYDIWLLKLDALGNGPAPSGVIHRGDAPDARALHLHAYPAPMQENITVTCSLPGPATVSLTVFALDGSIVRRLHCGARPAGRHVIRWDGRSDNGASAPAGVYLYRVDAGALSESGKILLIR